MKRIIVVRKNSRCKWFTVGSAINWIDTARILYYVQRDYKGWNIALTDIPESENSYIDDFRNNERKVYPAPIITDEIIKAIENLIECKVTPCNPNIIGALTTLGFFQENLK